MLAAESAFEQRDRVVEIFRAELRLLAACVLAVRVQFGPGPEGEAQGVPELLRALRARGLTDGQWVALVRELLRPWANAADAYPIAALVKLVHSRKSELVKLWDELLVMRKSETVAHGASGTRDALLAILHRRTPQLARTLELLDPVFAAYRVVAVRNGEEREQPASLFVGPTAPSGRARTVDLATDVLLAAGEVALLDGGGRAKVLLSPIVMARRPTRESAEELFLLDGSARRGALYVAFPSMAEHKEPSAWESLSEVISDEEAPLSEGDLDGRPVRPYRGLASFGPEEASLFFGREEQAETLSNRIRRHGWVTVTGPSGSGKTSLLRAGVLPTLENTMVAFLRPGAHPLASLASRLADATELGRDEMDVLVRSPAKLSQAIDRVARAKATSLVLVVDQGEELLTLAADEVEREAFGRALVALAERHGSARVVFSVREDFFARLANVRALFGVFSAQVEVVTTPDREALVRMLLGPARAFGYAFEDEEIVTRLLDSIADARAALALLSFTADRLWEARDRKWKRLTVAAYEAMGGAVGALAAHADSVLAGMAPSELTATRSILLRLVTGERTRAVVARAEILEASRDADETSRVVDRLIDGRLLTAGEDADGTATLEIVHEALIQHWSTLARYLSEDEEGQRLTHALRQSAREWAQRGRPRGLVWRGELLDELHLYLRRAREPLTGNERAFAEACDKDARTQARLRQSLLGGAFLALAAFAGFMFWQWQRAEAARVETERQREETSHEKMRAEVRGLVAEARSKEGRGLGDDAHALMRAAVQLEGDLGVTEETAQSLDLARLDAAGAGAMVFTGPTRPIMHVRTAALHRRIIASGSDDDVFVLDGDTGETVGRLPHPDFIVWDLKVSTGQGYLATASSDNRGEKGLLRVYALPSLELVVEHHTAGAGLREVVFGDDDSTLFARPSKGSVLAVALPSGEQRVLGHTGEAVIGVAAADNDVAALSTSKETRVVGAEGETRLTIAAEGRDVTAIAVSHDGKMLARGRADGWVDLFDAGSGVAMGRVQTQNARVGGLALVDGYLIAASEQHKLDVIELATKERRTLDTGGSGVPRFTVSGGVIAVIEDKSVAAIDLRSGTRLLTRAGHDGEVLDVGLYGGRLLSAGWDRTIRLWPDRPYPVTRIAPANMGLSQIAFSQDRQRVAIAPQSPLSSNDVTVNATSSFEKPLFQRRPPGFMRGLALDARGEQLATATESNGAEVIEVNSGRTLRTLVAPGPKLTTMAALPDFGKIAVGDNQGILHLASASNAAQSYGVVSDAIVGVALSVDGALVATTGGDRVARLNRWDDGAEVFAITLKGVAGELAFSPDGALFAVGDHGSVRVFRLDDFALLFQRDSEENAVIGLSFSPDSRKLAAATSSSGGDGLWLVDLADGTVRVLETKEAALDLSFAPEGGRLLAGHSSGKLSVWQDGSEPASVYRPFSRGVLGARFSADGREVLAVSFGSGMATIATPPADRKPLLERTGGFTTLRVCRATLAVVAVPPGASGDAFTTDARCSAE